MKQVEENQYAKKCRATLIDKIARFGAITTEDFMAHCLTDPQFGYYRHAKLGQDFITAPMLSQEFGATVGAWVELNWKRLRKPRKVMLVEAGAGRGELLHDVLYYLQENCRELMPCLFVQLVEVNQSLRQKQAQVFAKFSNSCRLRGVAWHENLEDVPEGTAIFIANEFFDALPTRQYVLLSSRSQKSAQSNPHEYQSFMRRVAVTNDSLNKYLGLDQDFGLGFSLDFSLDFSSSLRFVRAEQQALPPILLKALGQQKTQRKKQANQKGISQKEINQERINQEGMIEQVIEISPRTLAITANLAQVLARFGGAVLICDYGYSSQKKAKKGGSLQAFFRHKVVDPLLYYGACDMSVEVDFESIANEFRELDECSITTQREFLRDDKAFRQKNKDSHIAERNERLVAKDAMGERFKVLTAFSNRPS